MSQSCIGVCVPEEIEKICENCRWGPYVDSKNCMLCTKSRIPRTDRWTPSKEMRAKTEMKAREEEERKEREAALANHDAARPHQELREQMCSVMDLLRCLDTNRRGVPIEALIEAALKNKITEDRLRAILKRLADSGDLYSPQPGYFRVASQ